MAPPFLFPGGFYPLREYLPLPSLATPLDGRSAADWLTAPAPCSHRREALKEVQVAALGVLILAAGGYLFRLDFVSRPFLLLFWCLNALGLATMRVLERRTRWGQRLAKAPRGSSSWWEVATRRSRWPG